MRSPRESSFCVVPDCRIQVPVKAHASVKEFTVSVAGPVKVELLGVVKFTWNLNRSSVVVVNSSRKKFGSPAGGAVLPSRSLGRNEKSIALGRLGIIRWKQTAFALSPASMWLRLWPQTLA